MAARIAVYGVASAGILVAVTLSTIIHYYNRPRSLVPPHLRDQAGRAGGPQAGSGRGRPVARCSPSTPDRRKPR